MRVQSGGAQVIGGTLLCAVEGCDDVALIADCLCLAHTRIRDGRQAVMHEIAVKAGYATEGLSFGDALVALKAGKKVARSGWNGKGMWLALLVPDANSKMLHPYVYLVGMDGKPVPWTPNALDMLAEDWCVVQ